MILAPAMGEGGYELVDVAGDEPWASLALMQAVRVHEGGELRYETAPDPEPGPGEVVVELRTAALNRRDLLVTPRRLPVPAAARARLGRRRRAPRHGRGGRDLPGARLGRSRGGVRARLPDPRRPARRDLRGARGRARGERLPEAGAALVGGGGGAAARRPDRVPGAVLARRARARARRCSCSARAAASRRSPSSSPRRRARACSSPRPRTRRSSARASSEPRPASTTPRRTGLRAVKEHGGVDLVIDSVGSTWPQSLDCLRPGGRVVVFGATGGTEAELPVRPFYFGQWSLLGTMMGSPADFAGLLRALERGSWRPVIDSVAAARRRRRPRSRSSKPGRNSASWCSRAAERRPSGETRRARPSSACTASPATAAASARSPRSGSPVVSRDRGRLPRPRPLGLGAAVERRAARRRPRRDRGGARDLRARPGWVTASAASSSPSSRRVIPTASSAPCCSIRRMHIEPAVAGERADLARADVSFAQPRRGDRRAPRRRLAVHDAARDPRGGGARAPRRGPRRPLPLAVVAGCRDRGVERDGRAGAAVAEVPDARRLRRALVDHGRRPAHRQHRAGRSSRAGTASSGTTSTRPRTRSCASSTEWGLLQRSTRMFVAASPTRCLLHALTGVTLKGRAVRARVWDNVRLECSLQQAPRVACCTPSRA